jgi:hypothetical protein
MSSPGIKSEKIQEKNQEKPMANHKVSLSERLKRLGFAHASSMRLYGEEFELLSDPIVVTEDVVFFDAIEKKSRQTRRVRIPLNIVNMASRRQAA